ncbi:Polysaccharide biosynthesis glucuronosyltransferase protein [Methylorubrum extorquens]
MRRKNGRLRLLAVASGGGHWIQLLRVLPAFGDCDCAFVSTLDAGDQVGNYRFYRVPDANRWNKLAVIRMSFAVMGILLRERPAIVISTGAAPGCIALLIGRLMGAKTIWLDSFANVDTLSMSGRMAGWFSHLWLTQWKHLAKPEGPHYEGSVI